MVDGVCVPPQAAHIVWPEVAHLIARAMARADMGSFERVEEDVLEGRALLWLAWQGTDILGAVVTQITLAERSKVCTIVAFGGADVMPWLHLITKLEDYAKAESCDVVRIVGRRGWARVLPGYRPSRNIILERRL